MKWSKALGAAIAAPIFAGCSINPSHSEPPPSIAHDGKEVKDVHCGTGAFDAIITQHVSVQDVRGYLSMRKSRDCPLLYWGQFTPDKDNKAWFAVTVASEGRVYYQKPKLKNPASTAWTPGLAAREGDGISVCLVADTTHKSCFGTVAV